ncbi:MAG: phosphoglycerate dehydrogenase [Planctomycetota bacterium]
MQATEAHSQPEPATSFPRGRIRVVLLEGPHESGSEVLRGSGFTVDRHAKSLEGDTLREALAEARVLGIRSKTRITREVLDAAPKLLAIGAFCIGTNQIDLPEATARGIPVFNAPFSNTRSVAELTISELVALHRRLVDRSAAAHAGRWEKSAAGSREIRGKTLGIVGYGHIGSQVSVLAEAMGMRVMYYDAVPKLPLGNAEPVRSLGELLERSDAVTLHVPSTAQTSGLIGRDELARMKQTAYLINNARGEVVDIDALAEALRAGRLGGAAVDVFPQEPRGAGEAFSSVLQGIPNVILTPHIGGSTEEAQENISLEVADKLARFIDQGTTTGAVNVPEVDLPDQSRATAGPRPHRILNFHRNEAGFLKALNTVVADAGANVAGQYLRTNESIGYVVIDVDPSDGEQLRGALGTLPGSIRTRLLW